MSKRTYRLGHPPYPANWGKVTQVLRRVVGRCERCGATQDLTVHHQGIPYPDGRPGDPRDKHDLRRENLICICCACHDRAEPVRVQIREIKARRKRRRARHRALGVGTGLVLYKEGMVA
jgi:hypothetical protein